MRKPVLLVALVVLAWPAGAGSANGVKSGFFFGRVAFEDDVVALDIRQRHVRVFVTDAQPAGTAHWFEGRIRGNKLSLVSANRRARLRATLDSDGDWLGTITYTGRRKRNFGVTRAAFGAGIYSLTVEQDGLFHGSADDGNRFDGRQDGRFLTGVLTEKNGTARPVRIADLSLAYGYGTKSGRPGTYATIVARRGTLIYGRSGINGLLRGKAGRNLLAYDVAASEHPTPGFYFGRVAFSRIALGVKVYPPDENGVRRIRALATDSEPEPRGELQWFEGTIGIDDKFRLASATGNARLRGTVESDFVSGTMVLSGGQIRKLFAAPAGEGAGIYDLTIDENGRMRGTSEEGGTLDVRPDGLFIVGRVTTADGTRYPLRIGDLTLNLRYPIAGNEPGRYVAIVASRGRLIFGRDGDVRAGAQGLSVLAGEQAG